MDTSPQGISRRAFVKASSTAILGTIALGASGCSFPKAAKELADSVPAEGAWVRTTCAPNCTGATRKD